MLKALIIVILLNVVYAFWKYFRDDSLPFWNLVKMYPNEAYEWFLQEKCWVMYGPDDNPVRPAKDYTGPFWLYIPMLGWRKVTLYCEAIEIELSQKRFVEIQNQIEENHKNKSKNLNEKDLSYRNILDLVHYGVLLMGIDPALARQYYVNLPASMRMTKTGDSQNVQSIIIRLTWALSIIIMFICSFLSIKVFTWWSLIIIPALVGIYVLWMSSSSVGKPKFLSAIIFTGICWGVAYYYRGLGLPFILLLSLLPLMNVLLKLMYYMSAEFLRNLSYGSEQAYTDLYISGIVFFKNPQTGELYSSLTNPVDE